MFAKVTQKVKISISIKDKDAVEIDNLGPIFFGLESKNFAKRYLITLP